MDVILLLMLVVACLIAIVISIGPVAIYYLGEWLKSKLTRSRKTKTDPTV